MSVTSTAGVTPRATQPSTTAAPKEVAVTTDAATATDAAIGSAPSAAQASTYYSPKFFKGSIVRDLIKEHDRRVSPEFLALLDAHIKATVIKACGTFIGTKKTLDEAVAIEIGITSAAPPQ